MNKHFAKGIALAGLAIAAVSFSHQGQAHHSFVSEFDRSKPVEVQGVVTSARIVNPHAWLYLDVRNSDGTKTNWGFEFGTPILLKTKGIAREDVRPGTTVRIVGYRSKNTGPFGYAQTVVLGDGRSFEIGSAPDAPGQKKR